MAERLRRIDVRDPHTMALQRSLPVPCDGINHADYAADQSFFVASCEFSGKSWSSTRTRPRSAR